MGWSQKSVVDRLGKLGARARPNPRNGEIQVLNPEGSVVYSGPNWRDLGEHLPTVERVLAARASAPTRR